MPDAAIDPGLEALDYWAIVGYLAVTFWIGVNNTKKDAKSK